MVELQAVGMLDVRVSIFEKGQTKLGSITDGSTLNLLLQLLLNEGREKLAGGYCEIWTDS